MGARSWSSAPSVPSSHSTATSSVAATTTTAGPLFTSSSSSSSSPSSSSSCSLSSSPSCSPPSSSSPSPTGGKKHRRHLQQLQQQQQQPTKTKTTTDRHAFIRIPVGENKSLETPQSVASAKAAAAAAAAQRAERNLSVKRDSALDLPTCPSLPDGEEKPYGSSVRLRIRDHEQESEIYRGCIRPPPNRTVHEIPTSFPPFRCNSESILTDPSTPVGRMKPGGPATTTSSSPSSILAVCCASSTSLSSSGSSGGYGYRNLSHHYNNYHQPAVTARPGDDNKDSFLEHSNRLLLDIHGQPIVTRSKSMSTGSSLQQPDSYLTVMVPSASSSAHPPAKTVESAVKSYVRSLRERVHKPTASAAMNNPTTTTTVATSSSIIAAPVGVDNASFETSRRRSSCCHHADHPHAEEPSISSRSKLANLPVVSCASASTPSKPDGT